MSLYFNSFQRLRWNLGNYDFSQKKNQTSTYADIIFHDLLIKKKHVNKRKTNQKKLHNEFFFIHIHVQCQECKHKTCSIEMKFVIYVYFNRSGILLTRIKVHYSLLEVCTCMIIFKWNYHLWMKKFHLFKNILKLTVDSMSIILNSPFCEWTLIEGSHWIQQKSIVFRLFFKFKQKSIYDIFVVSFLINLFFNYSNSNVWSR